MKKRTIAALVAAATLVLGSLTVSADSPTTTTTPAPVATQTAKTETPTGASAQESLAKTSAVGFSVEAVDDTMIQAAKTAVQDRFLNDVAMTGLMLNNSTLMAAAKSDGTTISAEAISTVDVDPTSAAKDADGYYAVTLKIDGVKKGDIFAILHWIGTGWETLAPTEVSDGSVTFKSKTFSPISVVKFTVSGKITSPKTGEN